MIEAAAARIIRRAKARSKHGDKTYNGSMGVQIGKFWVSFMVIKV